MPIKPQQWTAQSRDNGGPPVTQNTPYSEVYQESCFIAWYNAGRPRFLHTLKFLPADENGRRPSVTLLSRWARENGWTGRADEMDGVAMKEIIQYSIQNRVEMFRQHADLGKTMQDIGWDYLTEFGAETSATAARLIKEGTMLERESTGMAQALERVAKLGNQGLADLIAKLMSKVDEKDIPALEAEFEEVDTT